MANRKKLVNLTGAELLQEAKKYDVLKEVTVSDKYKSNVYTNWSKPRIKEMLESLLMFWSEYVENRIKNKKQVTDGEFDNYFNLHLLFHFTTIGFDIPQDFETKVVVFDNLLKLDVLEEFFTKHFNKDDVAKAYEMFHEISETQMKLFSENEEYKKMFRQKVRELGLDNEDIINQVMFNGSLYEDENAIVTEDGEAIGEDV